MKKLVMNIPIKTISEFNPPEIPQGPINTTSLGMALGALMPENAIIVDESITTGREFFYQTSGSHPHTWLNNCGGSIGFGMPVAIGAAIACPNQKVISLEGDGSAMYTVQSLWTMARENLDIVILIFANQSYKILQGELKNVGVTNPGKSAIEMLSLRNPELDWVSISQGMGVDAVKVDNIEDLVKYFSLDRVNKSGAIFDREKLIWMNREYIKKIDEVLVNKVRTRCMVTHPAGKSRCQRSNMGWCKKLSSTK